MLRNFDNSDFHLINEQNIITDKLEMITNECEDIRNKLYEEQENNINLNEKYKNLLKQEILYKEQIPEEEKEKIKIENKKTNEIINEEKNENDDINDNIIILETLKNLSEKIKENLSKADYLPEHKKPKYDINITFQCINIIYVDLDDIREIKYKFQTFRITDNTTVKKLLKNCFELWEKTEISNYTLLFIQKDNNIIKLNENDVINNIIKNEREIKNAQFFFCPNDFKPNLNNVYPDVSQDNFFQEKDKSSSKNQLTDFTKRIVGMSSYIESEFENLKKEEEEKKNAIEIPIEKKKISIKSILRVFIHIFFIIFLILSIKSLKSLSMSNNMYDEISIIKERCEKNIILDENYFFSNSEIIRNQIIKIFDDFYYDSSRFIQFPYMLISQARISFFKSTSEKCIQNLLDFLNNNNNNNNFNCISQYYKYDKSSYFSYYSPYIQEYKYETYVINGLNPICDNSNLDFLNFLVYTNSTFNNNFISNCKDLFNYYYDLFSDWNGQIEESEKIKIKGDFGIYKDNSINLFININFINKKVLEVALNFLTHEAIDNKDVSYDYFSSLMNKACFIDFTVYNFFSENYYYISFLYEFSNNAGSKSPKMKIIPFQPNLSIKHKNSKVIENFRFLFCLFDFVVYWFYIIYKNTQNNTGLNIKKRKKKKNKGCLNSSIQLTSILTIISLIIFLRIFIVKRKHLYQNINNNEEIDIELGYFKIKNKGYFNIAKNYEETVILECILMTLLLLRLITYLNKMKTFKTYFRYLKLSLIKALPYFLSFFSFIFVFSIISHQIFGLEVHAYNTYINSILSTLEMSIFHFKNIYVNKNINFQFIYIFAFTLLVSYFNIQMFFGLYLENYRLINLKYGNIYEKIIGKKKKKSENTSSNNEDNGNSDNKK